MIQTLTKNFHEYVSDLTKDQETQISFQLDTNTLITVGKQFDFYEFSDNDSDVEVNYGESYQQILDFVSPDSPLQKNKSQNHKSKSAK